MVELLVCCLFLLTCLVVAIPIAIAVLCAFATPLVLLAAAWTAGPYWVNVRAGYKGIVYLVLSDIIGALFSAPC